MRTRTAPLSPWRIPNLDFWTIQYAAELDLLAERYPTRGLCIDLGQVDYVTGAALGKLVSLHGRVTDAGGRFSLRNVKPFALEILVLIGLKGVFEIEDREPVLACA